MVTYLHAQATGDYSALPRDLRPEEGAEMPPLLVTEDFVKRQTAHRQKLLREALAAVKAKEQAEAAQAAEAGSSNDPVVKQEPASSPAAAAAAQPQDAGGQTSYAADRAHS